MPTNIIDKNEARVPFLGDRMSFVTGLDPLGLQNPSLQAYAYLLPGLNNVTSRIRNYSFYCWLLAEYARIIQSTDPKEQKKFIRRAEYIIAYSCDFGHLIPLKADTFHIAHFRLLFSKISHFCIFLLMSLLQALFCKRNVQVYP